MKDSRFSLYSSKTYSSKIPLDISLDIDETRLSWGALYPHYPERRRFRFAEVAAISALAALFFLLGLGILLYYLQYQPTIVWSPTPTPTSTSIQIPSVATNLSATATPEPTATQLLNTRTAEVNQPTAKPLELPTELPTELLTELPIEPPTEQNYPQSPLI